MSENPYQAPQNTQDSAVEPDVQNPKTNLLIESLAVSLLVLISDGYVVVSTFGEQPEKSLEHIQLLSIVHPVITIGVSTGLLRFGIVDKLGVLLIVGAAAISTVANLWMYQTLGGKLF